MNTTLSKPVVAELSGTFTGVEIVPYIDHKVRQFCERVDLPIYTRDEYKDNNYTTGLCLDDMHKDKNCFFYDFTGQSVSSVIDLIECILGKKINNCRQYISAVDFYYELNYGSSDKNKNNLTVEIRNENGYVKLSVYDVDSDFSAISIVFKIENNIISFEIYGYYFKIALTDFDKFDILFDKFINNCHQNKIEEIERVIGHSNVTADYILKRHKISIFDSIQTTTTQLNIKNIIEICNEFNLNDKVISNENSGNQCYKTYDHNDILMLTDTILNKRDAFFIRQVVSFSHFRQQLSKSKKLVYRLTFRYPSKYKLKYTDLYNLSIFADNLDPTNGEIGDISIDIGDFENSALLLNFFQAKGLTLNEPKKYRNECPEDFFQLMKDSFKQEIAEKLDTSVNDLKTEHYQLYAMTSYMNC